MRLEMTPLLPDDVQAIRRASTLTFIADSEGRAKVRATLEKNDPVDFTTTEARIFTVPQYDWRPEREREFRVDGFARATGFTGTPNHFLGKRYVGTYPIITARFHPGVQTLGKLLRPGCGLELQFLADYSTFGSLAQDGYHADDFIVRIWTPVSAPRSDGRAWQPAYEFLLDTQVSKHNSARMVRAEGDASQASATLNIDDYWKVPA
jgi:hypothetical protein